MDLCARRTRLDGVGPGRGDGTSRHAGRAAVRKGAAFRSAVHILFVSLSLRVRGMCGCEEEGEGRGRERGGRLPDGTERTCDSHETEGARGHE
jgi:hypothetical protein